MFWLFHVQEVWLLKRDAANPGAVLDCHHCCGPFDGTIIPEVPAWPGVWSVDMVARVTVSQGGRSVWLKAEHRPLQGFAP